MTFSLLHIAYMVTDLDKTEKFYQDLFKMETIWKRDGDKLYLTTGTNDILGLLQATKEHPVTIPQGISFDEISTSKHTPNFFHFGFNTTDLAEFLHMKKNIESLGIIHIDKTSRDGTRALYVYDPDNYIIQITMLSEEYILGVQ